MLLRKINAVISLLTTILLLDHAIFSSVWMLSKGSVEQSAPIAPWILAGFLGIHAFISICFVFSDREEGETRKVKSYVHTVLSPIFFSVALAHTAISTEKAFITLGIGNAKVIKAISIVVKLICTATLIAAIAGFYLYVG